VKRAIDSGERRHAAAHRCSALVSRYRTSVSTPRSSVRKPRTWRSPTSSLTILSLICAKLAEAEAKRGNFAIAAGLYRNSIDQPITVSVHPMNRVIALERMAELYDLAGDHANAVAAYLAFAEAWKDADPELQPRARAARDRATILLAERVNPNREAGLSR